MKITKTQLKQIIKEELGAISEGLNTKENAGQLAEWLNINPNYKVAFQNENSTQHYRVYETWFVDEDQVANISFTPVSKAPMQEQIEEDKYEEIYGLATQAEEFARGVQDEKLKASLMDFFTRIAVAAQEGQEGTF
jgi:hypothetical protein